MQAARLWAVQNKAAILAALGHGDEQQQQGAVWGFDWASEDLHVHVAGAWVVCRYWYVLLLLGPDGH